MFLQWLLKINIKPQKIYLLIERKLLLENMENRKNMEIKLIIFLVIGINLKINMNLIDIKTEGKHLFEIYD